MDGGIAEAALIGAAIGGGTSAMRGQDPLKGAMMGGLMGGVGGGISGLMGSGAAAGAADTALTMPGATISTTAAPEMVTAGESSFMPFTQSAQSPLASNPMYQDMGVPSSIPTYTPPAPTPVTDSLASDYSPVANGRDLGAPGTSSNVSLASKGPWDTAKNWWGGLTPGQKLMTGGGLGLGAMMMSDSRRYGVPGQKPYTGPLSQFSYSPSYYRPSLAYAEGGITDLGGYSDGGRLLRGPGDGVSDSIPATIEGKQPARLADGEFVVPARVVSELGNGSTDAGAKKLYDMMHRVQKARKKTIGKKSLAIDSKADNFLPA